MGEQGCPHTSLTPPVFPLDITKQTEGYHLLRITCICLKVSAQPDARSTSASPSKHKGTQEKPLSPVSMQCGRGMSIRTMVQPKEPLGIWGCLTTSATRSQMTRLPLSPLALLYHYNIFWWNWGDPWSIPSTISLFFQSRSTTPYPYCRQCRQSAEFPSYWIFARFSRRST